MPDTPPPPVPPEPEADEPNRSPGYFNQEQLGKLEMAETVAAAAASHAEALAEQDITAAYVDGLIALVGEGRRRAAEAAAPNSNDLQFAEAKALQVLLQRLQSAARQKQRMLAEDGDPSTNFSTDGYLIGERLASSHPVLLQSAETLILRARADSLPGFKTADKIDIIVAALADYREAHKRLSKSVETTGLARFSRDDLIERINTRRIAVQLAADAIWHWTDEATRPIRRSFQLPPNRPYVA